VLADQLSHHAALGPLRVHEHDKTQSRFRDTAWQKAGQPEEHTMEGCIRDEAHPVTFLGQQRLELGANAIVRDQPDFDIAPAQLTEVVQGEDGLTAEAGRGIVGNDADAHVFRLRGYGFSAIEEMRDQRQGVIG
jgi:hypothetical protein